MAVTARPAKSRTSTAPVTVSYVEPCPPPKISLEAIGTKAKGKKKSRLTLFEDLGRPRSCCKCGGEAQVTDLSVFPHKHYCVECVGAANESKEDE